MSLGRAQDPWPAELETRKEASIQAELEYALVLAQIAEHRAHRAPPMSGIKETWRAQRESS